MNTITEAKLLWEKFTNSHDLQNQELFDNFYKAYCKFRPIQLNEFYESVIDKCIEKVMLVQCVHDRCRNLVLNELVQEFQRLQAKEREKMKAHELNNSL